MKILAIETSCDETAIAILDCAGDEKATTFRVLGNALLSQIELHRPYGGVFPSLAKREHAKNLVPVLEAALEEAEMLREDTQTISSAIRDEIAAILSREGELSEALLGFLAESEAPTIDAIAVTTGPGLEPALWVGINFAKALALAWEKPLIAVNHMEGHIIAALARGDGETTFAIEDEVLPILALLISGGHTELVVTKDWLLYDMIGQTRDDAVGEAFDKVARMLELPYPGGPEISRLAEIARFDLKTELQGRTLDFHLPRPMINDGSCDFSFAGLKTAVRYLLADAGPLGEEDTRAIAREFEDAVAEVLWKKTAHALEKTGARTLVIGGGVSANTHIRRTFTEHISTYSDVEICIPSAALTTDNALMIGMAGYYHALRHEFAHPDMLKANGNLHLAHA